MYRVYQVGEYGSEELLETKVFSEAKEYCIEHQLNTNNEFVVYDEFGIIVYESVDESVDETFGDYGVMGC